MPHRALLIMSLLKILDETRHDKPKKTELKLETTLKCGTKVELTVAINGEKRLKLVKPD